MDLHLIAEGRHEELWTALGANVRRYPGPMGEVQGTSFAVWAPNARAVRVVGDFNHWQGATHAMRELGGTGVWELFVPGVAAGTVYKYEILTQDGSWRQKADPLAKGTELPPATASVVVESSYAWGDKDWIDRRTGADPHQGPMSIYEVHLGSWRPGLGYRELADQLVEHVVEMGFTHVEFLPVAEHPFGGSWGYQVSSYYAPTSRFGSPDDFRLLVDRLHQAGVGVIVDWVPAHFPKDEWALGRFDGTPLYEHPDPLLGEHPDWGTFVFDFGRSEVRNFLVANATYWLEEFHVDGLRVDAVASMLYLDYSRSHGQWRPNVHGGRENLDAIAFIQEANATAYRRTPGILMIAEESTAWPGVTTPTSGGGLGYGLKWNMGWMNDTLRYLAEEPINRQVPPQRDHVLDGVRVLRAVHPAASATTRWCTARARSCTRCRATTCSRPPACARLLTYQWTHPGKQLLFMGSEFGQTAEWSESRGLDWHLLEHATHQGIARLVVDLNRFYRSEPALWALDGDPAGFEWIDSQDAGHNVLTYIRRDGERPQRGGRGELRRGHPRGLPARPAVGRGLARGDQHRRRRLRRLGRGEHGPGRGLGAAAARPGLVGERPAAGARCDRAGPRGPVATRTVRGDRGRRSQYSALARARRARATRGSSSADHCEQRHEPLAGALAVRPGGATDHAQQPVERGLDAARGQLEVGHRELCVQVRRVCGAPA